MLKNKLIEDLKIAMKEGRSFDLGVLRMIVSAVKNKEIEKKGRGESEELNGEEVLAVLRSEAKKRKDSAMAYKAGNRPDLEEQEEKELKFIERYLPPAASGEEIEKAVNDAIRETGARDIKDMGKVIAQAMRSLGGRAEGGTVSGLVREKLG